MKYNLYLSRTGQKNSLRKQVSYRSWRIEVVTNNTCRGCTLLGMVFIFQILLFGRKFIPYNCQ